jgi:murein DD-endopeptidase MepM/ murein hydrolase activator NlpD
MSYSDCLARISQLDALIREYDPYWAASGLSLVSSTGTGTSGAQSFSSVLNGVATATPASAAAAPAATTAPKAAVHPVIKSVGSTTFNSPLPGSRLTQPFGPTDVTLEPPATVNGVAYAHYHNGIDLAAPLGTPVLAAADGVVTFAGKESDGAIIVKISHNDDEYTLYGHLDPSLSVKVGQHVTIGQTIGKVGMTGVTTGPHLHFGVYSNFNKTWVDPSSSIAAGHLVPDRSNLMGPSATDPGAMVQVPGATTLAHFDAIASHIPYAAQIRAAAVAAGIDPTLLAGLVYAESSFRPAALSPSGAMGLTQLMPSAAKTLGVNPWDIQQNLNGGAKYIANLLTRFGRTDLALAAYNAGPGAIAALGVVPDSKKPYVSKILDKWKSYQGLTS